MRTRWVVTGVGLVFAYFFVLSYISQVSSDASNTLQFTIAPTVPPDRYSKSARTGPICSWADEAAGRCQIDLGNDLRVGVLTYHGAHDKVQLLRQSWMKDYLIGQSVFIISDKADPANNIIDSGCSDGLAGLSCKTLFLFKSLYERDPNAKWYLRAMDDTYVHLPNLLQYLSQYDHHSPLIIGMRQVISPVNEHQRFEESQGPQYRPIEIFFPQGGCGWVLSNEYVRRMLQPENLEMLNWFFLKYWMVDDLAMGEYTEKHMKIALLSYKGFSHIAWTRDNCPPNYVCPEGQRVPSNMTFLTVHARNMWEDMPALHNVFLENSFTAEYLPSRTYDNDWAQWRICQCTDSNEYMSVT
eukprot:Phypoly_transcript_11088.p1 GENE.Phypoly_transcript_11088~~Phypoly_transcript_11088.p1  ORF type:complete len:355 (+),score=16.62 Phypoly_transcript_11088:180-1244(+)